MRIKYRIKKKKRKEKEEKEKEKENTQYASRLYMSRYTLYLLALWFIYFGTPTLGGEVGGMYWLMPPLIFLVCFEEYH